MKKLPHILLSILYFIPITVGLIIYYVSKIFKALGYLFMFELDKAKTELTDFTQIY